MTLELVVRRISTDSAFAAAFRADPEATLRQEGVQSPHVVGGHCPGNRLADQVVRQPEAAGSLKRQAAGAQLARGVANLFDLPAEDPGDVLRGEGAGTDGKEGEQCAGVAAQGP